MSKLYCLGELLIDFQSVGTSPLKDTERFVKKAGGAPANACVQAAKLGVDAAYLTKVGQDAFGDFLVETLRGEGVDVSRIGRSAQHDTSLAFVSFTEGGERQFAFYRRTAADLSFTSDDFADVVFRRGDAFEFGSVALATECARQTHLYLIDKARVAGAMVCFDPNLRFNLWNRDELRSVVRQFAPLADVVKVGKEELEFITELTGEQAVQAMFTGNTRLLAVTDGGKGAQLYADGKLRASCAGYKVATVDTTGAGDSFFGGFIARLMENGVTPDDYASADYGKILDFACKCGAYTTMSFGAIAAMGNKEKINKAVK